MKSSKELKSILDNYLNERLKRSDVGNSKGYRGHTILIQESYFNNIQNFKNFVDVIGEIGFIDLSNREDIEVDGKKIRSFPNTESYIKASEKLTKNGYNYALLKNFTPQVERMGLIDADNYKNGTRLGFKLSQLGDELYNSDNIDDWWFICNKSVRNVFEFYQNQNGFDFIGTLYDIIVDCELNSIDINEMFIILDDLIELDEKKKLILIYKKITKTITGRLSFKDYLKNKFDEYNTPDKTKLEKRDLSNIKNQIYRIMEKLNLMMNFKYDENNEILTLKDNNVKYRYKFRSGQDIKEAKVIHNIENNSGLDGHHIVPHENIITLTGTDRKLIENANNIIFLPKKLHNKFPNKNNNYIKLVECEKSLKFISIINDDDYIEIDKDLFNGDHSHIPNMISHNKEILRYLSTKIVQIK